MMVAISGRTSESPTTITMISSRVAKLVFHESHVGLAGRFLLASDNATPKNNDYDI